MHSRPAPCTQELLARLRRRGFRVNLRPLADMRTLAWIPVAWLLLSYGLRFLAWLVVAIATGPAEQGGSSSGGGQRAYPHHHQY